MKTERLLLASSAFLAMAAMMASPVRSQPADNPQLPDDVLVQKPKVELPRVSAHGWLDWDYVDSDQSPYVNGTQLRLLRIGVQGKYANMKYNANVDFAGSKVSIKDIYVQWAHRLAKVRLGNFKEPHGLEQGSSLYGRTFMEGSTLQAVNGLGRKLGVVVQRNHGKLNLQAGVFSTDVNNEYNEDGSSFSVRSTLAPMQDKKNNRFLHLGVSSRYRQAGESQGDADFVARAFSNKSAEVVDSGTIGESDIFVGLEGAAVFGPLSIQAESGWTRITCGMNDCLTGGGEQTDPQILSSYVDVSYIFGGQRTYDPKTGYFKRQKIYAPTGQGGPGAFELAARYDYTDANDVGLRAGRKETVVAGASYYMNKYVKFLVNYSHSDIKGSTLVGDDTVNSVSARAQIEFY